MKSIVVGVLMLCSMSMTCAAQALLGFVHTTTHPSHIEVGDTVHIDTYLMNFDSTSFNDSLHFGLLHNGDDIHDPQIFPSPYPGGSAIIEHINHGDSVLLHFKIIVKQSEFSVGVTGVVIWPISINQNFVIHDSLRQQINIEQRTGIDNQMIQSSGVECVLVNRSLHVAANSGAIDARQVHIYNETGQLLYTSSQTLPIDIPLDNFPAGVVVVQVELKDGSQVIKKVFVPSK